MNALVVVSEADLAQAQREKGWTATRIAVAKALFNSGMSSTNVGALLGVSRNAIIGKVHRDGLANADRKRPTDTNRRKRRRRAVNPPKLDEEPLPQPLIEDAKIPKEQRRTLFQLDRGCCRWPVGDPGHPGFFFCGASKPNKDEVPYCASHMRRVHAPQGRRRDPDVAAYKSKVNAGRVNRVWR